MAMAQDSSVAAGTTTTTTKTKVVVLMGTCGWSDHTLLKCGRFYPASVRSTEDRLRYYSNHFPCVEVDTSTYAIPSIPSVKAWLRCIPERFLFHFKAFGLFCRNELWDIFNSTLRVAYSTGNLGVVIFQFHLDFKYSIENQTHVEWCRQNLDPCYSMAAEFRCRDWFNEKNIIATTAWLEKWGIALIAADELHHETFQKDRKQLGLAKGQDRVILPIAWALTQPNFMYIRLHRREGTQRLLLESELLFWASRLKDNLPSKLEGPIYFMWGTDWEDQPIINAKRLADKLGNLAFDWKMFRQCSKKGLDSYFPRKTQNDSKVEREELVSTLSGKRQLSTCNGKNNLVYLDETCMGKIGVTPPPKKVDIGTWSAKKEGRSKLKISLPISKYFEKSSQ